MDTPGTLSGWLWWVVSVVIVGILINLLSSFIYPKLERELAKRSDARKKVLAEKERAFQERIQELRKDPFKVVELKIELIQILLTGIVYGVILMVVDDVILPILFRLEIVGFRLLWWFNPDLLTAFISMIATFVILVLIMVQWNKFRLTQLLLRSIQEVDS